MATRDETSTTTTEKRGLSEVVITTSAALVAANQGIDLVGKLNPKSGGKMK